MSSQATAVAPAASAVPRLSLVALAERVVVDGDVITAAGVSTGVDMALTLTASEVGDDVARALQRIVEYDPQPPYDSGSPAKADAETSQRATELLVAGIGDDGRR